MRHDRRRAPEPADPVPLARRARRQCASPSGHPLCRDGRPGGGRLGHRIGVRAECGASRHGADRQAGEPADARGAPSHHDGARDQLHELRAARHRPRRDARHRRRRGDRADLRRAEARGPLGAAARPHHGGRLRRRDVQHGRRGRLCPADPARRDLVPGGWAQPARGPRRGIRRRLGRLQRQPPPRHGGPVAGRAVGGSGAPHRSRVPRERIGQLLLHGRVHVPDHGAGRARHRARRRAPPRRLRGRDRNGHRTGHHADTRGAPWPGLGRRGDGTARRGPALGHRARWRLPAGPEDRRPAPLARS